MSHLFSVAGSDDRRYSSLFQADGWLQLEAELIRTWGYALRYSKVFSPQIR